MVRLVDEEALDSEIAALDALSFADLKARHATLTGTPPPKRISRRLLMLALAYEMQRKAYGVRADRLARRIASAASNGTAPPTDASLLRRSLKSGGRFVREWRGRNYEVYVAEDGCYLDGERFGSLSAVAEAVTGVKRNGPAFFGLRSRRAFP